MSEVAVAGSESRCWRSGSAGGRRFRREDHEPIKIARRFPWNRRDFESDGLLLAVSFDNNTLFLDGMLAFGGGVESAAQGYDHIFTRHAQDVEAGVAGHGVEIGTGVAAEVDNLQIGIDQNGTGRVFVLDDAVEPLLEIDAGGGKRPHGQTRIFGGGCAGILRQRKDGQAPVYGDTDCAACRRT